MTQEQIQKYEVCKEYLESLKEWSLGTPFVRKLNNPSDVSEQIDQIHYQMVTMIGKNIADAEQKVNKIISSL